MLFLSLSSLLLMLLLSLRLHVLLNFMCLCVALVWYVVVQAVEDELWLKVLLFGWQSAISVVNDSVSLCKPPSLCSAVSVPVYEDECGNPSRARPVWQIKSSSCGMFQLMISNFQSLPSLPHKPWDFSQFRELSKTRKEGVSLASLYP